MSSSSNFQYFCRFTWVDNLSNKTWYCVKKCYLFKEILMYIYFFIWEEIYARTCWVGPCRSYNPLTFWGLFWIQMPTNATTNNTIKCSSKIFVIFCYDGRDNFNCMSDYMYLLILTKVNYLQKKINLKKKNAISRWLPLLPW